MGQAKYHLLKQEGRAKRGEFHTVHGVIQTPVFMNVGTVAAIKGAVSTEDLESIGTLVELSNTYHLHVRPGDKLIKELGVDLSDFDFIRIQNDFHNLKASVKAVYTESDAEHLFISGGKYDAHHIYSCVKASEFSSLPEVLSLVAEEAYKTLLKTSDGQLCDMIIDICFH